MSSNMISVIVSNNLNSFENHSRFADNIVILDLKKKLELITGVQFDSMQLQLLNKNKVVIENSLANDRVLKSYPIEMDMFLHAIETAPQKAIVLEDLSAVPKYEIDEEKYGKRDNTFRAFKTKHHMKSPSDETALEQEQERKFKEDEILISKMSVGDRCRIQVINKPERIGTVMYLGKTEFQPGFWVGVKYDEPVGKNDGSVKGTRYFECSPLYGGFVKPCDVTIEVSDMDTDEI